MEMMVLRVYYKYACKCCSQTKIKKKNEKKIGCVYFVDRKICARACFVYVFCMAVWVRVCMCLCANCVKPCEPIGMSYCFNNN